MRVAGFLAAALLVRFAVVLGLRVEEALPADVLAVDVALAVVVVLAASEVAASFATEISSIRNHTSKLEHNKWFAFTPNTSLTKEYW